MKFEERRSVRSAFAGTAGGFVSAATIARPDASTPAVADTRTNPVPAINATALPERR